MQEGQWSSTAAVAHYLHNDDEAKQDAQMKRIKRRAKLAKQATASEHLSEWKARLVRMKLRDVEPLKTLERVKGIEPSYSAWKSLHGNFSLLHPHSSKRTKL